MVTNDIISTVRYPRARASSSPRSASAPPASNGSLPEREDSPIADDEPRNTGKTLLSPISAPISTVYDDILGSTKWQSPWWDDESEDEDDESEEEDDKSDDEDDESEDEGVHNQSALDLDREVKKLERAAAHFQELLAAPDSQTAPDAQIAPDSQTEASQAQVSGFQVQNEVTQARHRHRVHHDEETPRVVGVRLTSDNQEWPWDARTDEGALTLTASIYCTLIVILVMVGLDHLWHRMLG
ncbi:uncharacterized protein DNG_09528 [Cephalotrichum gorgonifer]|uniref:Uncharacterized protein n=1 Tax=Cephalotrichum gorgonifer TaxID=2041049 RepID=A0AAE8N723_9PEZI|nr:uncharacterized protein DNG_09528 [Cephalotrichum gorgonifer]